ncbi:hypothetical protein Skr01_09250 [Sphaerisporangium krabiense]|uniref:Small membrane hydrophobic protein n=1 Tax=Sphaerisporangium krabiense TaxID=763782 RepID=A0A7W8ZCC7_9ACTN|nr:DUF4267 domain-containing protein [Sphaerisporangium krabiense]MBB5631422.1 hypothetical protein [Sphaerisporangium krabiense]GII60840.1 hypothetical protein Skr01_09250 [Sphaerisporangium krabiense]
MSLRTLNTFLATAGVLFILYIGVSYVLTPETTAPGFGLPNRPSGDGDGFLILKGIRDITSGLVLGILLLTGHRRALGWVLLMEAVTPFGDMIDVLAHHGSTAAAFGVHGLTSALIVVTGLLTLRETGKARKAGEAVARPA